MKETVIKKGEDFVSRNLLKLAGSVILFGLFLMLIAPYFFTQMSGAYDLTDKGQIGDAISGTTAPIVGLIGSILVFLSLYAQIQANRLVISEFETERERYHYELERRENEAKVQDRQFREGQLVERLRTLLELARDKNQDILALTAVDNAGRVRSGTDAVYQIVNVSFNGGHSREMALLKSILVGIDGVIDAAEIFDLSTDQKHIVGSHLFGVISKIATYITATHRAEGSPIVAFARRVDQVMERTIGLVAP